MSDKNLPNLNGGKVDKNGTQYPWYWEKEDCKKYPDLNIDVYCPFFGGVEFSLGFRKKPNGMFTHKIKLIDLLRQASGEGWKLVSHIGYNNTLD